MYNYNLRRGTIWKIKGTNSSDRSYPGMDFNDRYVLVLSNYRDEKDVQKFTFLSVEDSKVWSYKSYLDITVNNKIMYVEMDRLLTGDVRALSNYICDVNSVDMERVLNMVKLHFNIFRKQPKVTSQTIIKNKYNKKNSQLTIHKFGIDIYVTPGPGVSVSEKSKRLILAYNVKEDIIYNSKTDEDIKLLSDKYSIYPTKAIREIRNRLVYQHKQKEG